MRSVCHAVDDDPCPVSDHVLAQLYSADERSLRGLLDAIDPEIKPELAFYCYRRAHLETVGLVIAANCKESELAWRRSGDDVICEVAAIAGFFCEWTAAGLGFVEDDDDALPSAAPA